jgi:hypothetical protein
MNGLIRSIIPAILSLSLGLAAPAVSAKGECKGMSKSACSADKSCSWVKSYVTKTGKKVGPYCRIAAGKKKAGEKKSESKKLEKSGKAEKTSKKVKEKAKKKSKEETKP